jgi:hypothetical protein
VLNRFVALTLRVADVRAREDGFSVAAVVRGTEDSEDLDADEVGARKAGAYAVYIVSGGGVEVRRFDSRADAGKP